MLMLVGFDLARAAAARCCLWLHFIIIYRSLNSVNYSRALSIHLASPASLSCLVLSIWSSHHARMEAVSNNWDETLRSRSQYVSVTCSFSKLATTFEFRRVGQQSTWSVVSDKDDSVDNLTPSSGRSLYEISTAMRDHGPGQVLNNI